MNLTTSILALAVALTSLLQSNVIAQEATDKWRYSLSNPTPQELWRPMSADRPDFTESPITVDAGAVQIEMSLADYTKNGDSNSFGIALTNLKIGLLNNTDIQFVYDPYVKQDDGVTTTDGGGDMQIRLKINFWGNDGGDTAFGIMPFVKIPTASEGLGNDKVEGGVIFPWGTELASGVGLGLMFEVDFNFDTATQEYDTDFIGTGVLGFDLNDQWGWYLEGINMFSSDSGIDYRFILGVGATYAVNENFTWDAGVNFGLSGEVDDTIFFTGITVRW
ncbi:MAG: transporter [Planctomycetes bacterium]|nr:transporter [Planctomycetota bacterium]